ncbi:MAG: diguanylate cyclase [Idiomarina sp.]|nr:diguanylate cyclase [Idiomarina sp.]
MLKRVTNQLKPNRLLPVVAAALLILLVLALSFLYTVVREFYYFAQHEHQNYAQKYAANVAATERLANTVYESIILRPEVLDIVQRAQQGEAQADRARNDLYSELNTTYQALRNADIQQLHFHTADNHSFLRFHRPSLYGDDLTPVRPSVVQVNLTQQPFHGFEEGRIFNGYRHVYPLVHNGTHLGSVEISSSLLNFKRAYEENGLDSVDFALYASVVQATVFADEQDNYTQHPLHNDLVIQNELNEYAEESGIFDFAEKQAIMANLASRNGVESAVAEHEPYFGVILHRGQIYSVQMTPFFSDATGNPAGFIVNLTQFRYLRESLSRYYMQLVLFFIVSVAFALVLLRDRRLLAETQLLARVDNLTGLYNRLYFTVLTKKLLRDNGKPSESALRRKKGKAWKARQYSLIMFDIDHFKRINDTYGHDVGDVALETIADSIRAVFKPSDVFCRWGGEEFMALVRGDANAALQIAERLRKQIANDAIANDNLPNYTCSLGVVQLQSINQLEDALKAVDEALYRAKDNGRDRVELGVLASEIDK